MKKITKAVIPVAGYGTRFLPVVKTIPKEMIPVLNKPVLQLIVEKLVDAGIATIIFVTSGSKKVIEDYFDYHFELEAKLKERGKEKEYQEIRDMAELANFIFVRQKVMRGNGDAILCAKEIIGREPFLVTWGDGFTKMKSGNEFTEIIKDYQKHKTIIMSGYITDEKEDTNKYGYVKGKKLDDGIIEAQGFVEKPGPKKAPSNVSVVSGFLFSPDIFEGLEKVEIPEGEELCYIDGVNYLMKKGKKVYVRPLESTYYNCGDIIGWLKANVDFALKDKEIGGEFKKYLKNKLT